MEFKNEKFKRLANKRVPAAIEKLELIKNLANTNNYDYSKKTDEIIKALNKSINEIKHAFNNKKESKFRIVDTFNLFDALLKAENDDDVKKVLKQYDFLNYDPNNWKPLGGFENNEGFLAGQNPTPEGALVEKLLIQLMQYSLKSVKKEV